MKLQMLAIALLTALALPQSAQAANFTYHGQMMDGGAPANGLYDLKVRSYSSADRSKALGMPTEISGVRFRDGQFSVALDVPQDADGETYIDVAVRDKATGGAFESLGAPQRVVDGAIGCPGAWALDGNTAHPVGSYLGSPEDRTVNIMSPRGVVLNSMDQLGVGVELRVSSTLQAADRSVDVELRTNSGKVGVIQVNDNVDRMTIQSPGELVLRDGIPDLTTQRDGRSVVTATGRLRSNSTGPFPGDIGGGIWLDGDTPSDSYMGRGSNDQLWTGIYSGVAWRAVATDDGQFLVNTTTPLNLLDDMVIAARPAPGDADSDLVLQTRLGRRGRLFLSEATGGWAWRTENQTGPDFMVFGTSGARLTAGGVFTNASSRELKEGFAAIDSMAILEKLVSLPITTWTYKKSSEGLHIGPMAEDFKAAFGLAGNGKSIGTVDADGVALAAIQGLNVKLEAEQSKNTTLSAQVTALLTRLERLESKQAQ